MVVFVEEMPAHEGNPDSMAYDGCHRRSCDTLVQQLDKHDVKRQVDCIVDEDGDGHQPGTAVDTDHGAEGPHHHEKGCAKQHDPKVVERRLVQQFVLA